MLENRFWSSRTAGDRAKAIEAGNIARMTTKDRAIGTNRVLLYIAFLLLVITFESELFVREQYGFIIWMPKAFVTLRNGGYFDMAGKIGHIISKGLFVRYRERILG
jgi:hypothetical protein